MITTTDYEKHQIRKHVRAFRAKRVLEIGAFQGQTTRVLVDAVDPLGGHVVVIDPMQWSSEVLRNGIARHLSRAFPRALSVLERALRRGSYEDAFWQNVGGRSTERVSLYRALSTDPSVLQSDDLDLQEFDVAFIDGDHGYEGALHDLDQWGRRVRKGGVVLVHDATPRFPGVMRALFEWSDDPRVEVEWPTRDSLCVVHVLDDLRAARPLSRPEAVVA